MDTTIPTTHGNTPNPPKPVVEAKSKAAEHNTYMKDQIAKFEAEHPGAADTKAFQKVAGRWKDANEGPKMESKDVKE
ncbi:uncharacterized protein BDV17DRAFT_264330 [Aspergillus undulatus]|uniref:uncharacterized protein n=1 Tax=Aspergillus undulatus TaxID=1810928 RepID=UPI003CCD62D7